MRVAGEAVLSWIVLLRNRQECSISESENKRNPG